MIKAALSNVPVYHMSLFKMLDKVLSTLEKYQRDFLWKGGCEKKDHLIRWEVVSKSKACGGLGIRQLKERNQALMGKWLWCFCVERHSLWQSIIASRYGVAANGWDCRLTFTRSPSMMWKNILQTALLFYLYTRYGLGCGNRIRFWKDLWWSDHTLASKYSRLYRLSPQKDVIAEILSFSSTIGLLWNLNFFHKLFEREIPMVAHLTHMLNDVYISSHEPDVCV